MKKILSINICIISLFAFVFTSCKKDLTGDLPPNPTPPVYGYGDYQPANEGCYWVYNYAVGGNNLDVFTMKTSKDTMSFDTLTYQVLVNYANSKGLANSYIAVNNHNYFYRQPVMQGSGTPFPLSFLYLNDTYFDDDTWEANAGKNDYYTACVKGVIIAKDIDMTINNLYFPHVMHSKLDLFFNYPSYGSIKMATYDFYVALHVGIVKIECQVSPYSTDKSFIQSIISYTLK